MQTRLKRKSAKAVSATVSPTPFVRPFESNSQSEHAAWEQINTLHNDRAPSPSFPIQPKLQLGQPGDKYEQEADRVAMQVVQQMHQTEEIARQCIQCQSQADSPSSTIAPELEADLQRSQVGGKPLPSPLQTQMGSALGYDLSPVRVHTDDRADQFNQQLTANAFTMGNHIFFKRGEYSPNTPQGQGLIAHEVTHVVQQGAVTQRQLQRKPQEANTPKISLRQSRLIGPQRSGDKGVPQKNPPGGMPKVQGASNAELPTADELITLAGGYKAGTKVGGKSAFEKILRALDEFHKIPDDKIHLKLNQLIAIAGHINEWNNSSSRKKVKKGDAEKRSALVYLAKNVRQLLLAIASPEVAQSPEELQWVHQQLQDVIQSPYVNDATNEDVNLRADKFRTKSPVFKMPATINCALCSCAAVIRHVTGLKITTGDIVIRLYAKNTPNDLNAEFGGQLPEGYESTYQHPGSMSSLGYNLPSNVLAQAAAATRINEKNVDGIQDICALFGIQAAGTFTGKLTECVTWMSERMDECVFAVLVSAEGHWNFAHQGSNGQVEFIDYQSDHAEYGGTAKGNAPQVGIVNRSMILGDQNTTVIAFRK